MPERDDLRQLATAKELPPAWAALAIGGAIPVFVGGTVIFSVGGSSSMIHPSFPLDRRCLQVVESVFVEYWFVTLPCMAIMTGGMHMLVTAFVRRHRFLLNLGGAALLT